MDVVLQSPNGSADAVASRVFCLPSRSALLFRSLGQSFAGSQYATVVAPSLDWNFDYVWPYHVPNFSVFDIHTRRPYKAKPTMEQIQLHNQFSDEGSCSTTLLFDSTRALACFRKLLTRPTPQSNGASLSGTLVGVPPLTHLYEIILAIHEQMNGESLDFVRKIFNRATEIVHISLQPHGRFFSNDPSGGTQP